MEENKKMDREEKRGIFLGIIGVLTLIVAIIGASFAYFSVNAKSSDDAVTVQAASVQIVYEDGQELELKELIPSTKEIALETATRALDEETYTDKNGNVLNYELCRDDKNYTVCGLYDFSLTNNGENSVDLNMKIVPMELEEGSRGFKNLNFSLYDITEEGNASTQMGNSKEISTGVFSYNESDEGVVISYNEFSLLKNSQLIKLDGKGSGDTGIKKKYRLFIWLNETEDSQDLEQGAIFKGGVHIDVEGAENITGTIIE